jgi:hypothetical protein
MFSLFAFQLALTDFWVRAFAGFEAFCPAGYGPSRAEQKAAAEAMRELEQIVRTHSSARRQQADHD